jgi:hypothetical protein
VAHHLHLSRFAKIDGVLSADGVDNISICSFSNSMSNSQMKCTTHVQLDISVRKLDSQELCRVFFDSGLQFPETTRYLADLTAVPNLQVRQSGYPNLPAQFVQYQRQVLFQV